MTLFYFWKFCLVFFQVDCVIFNSFRSFAKPFCGEAYSLKEVSVADSLSSNPFSLPRLRVPSAACPQVLVAWLTHPLDAALTQP